VNRLLRRKGFFLILVVAVVAALTAILVRFGVDAQLETLISGNFRDKIIAKEDARSVLAGVKAAISEDKWQVPEIISLIAGQMSVKCKGEIEDEASKLPLNRLVLSGEEGLAVLQRFWELHGLSGRVLQALADWVDRDNVTIEGRAEEAAYGKTGIYFRNAPLQSVFELHLVPGWTDMMLKLGKLKSGVLRGLTVWGGGKINLLTADGDILSVLSDEMTPQLLEQIIEARELGSIRKMADFRKITGMNNAVFHAFQRWGTLKSTTFRVLIEAKHRKGRFRLFTILSRRENGVKTIYSREGTWQPM